MVMSKYEVIERYRSAKKPKEQVEILAQLNGCSRENIKDLLMDAGYMQTYVKGEDMMIHKMQIEKMLAENATLTDISRKFGANTTQMRKIFEKIGISIPEKKEKEPKPVEEPKITEKIDKVEVPDIENMTKAFAETVGMSKAVVKNNNPYDALDSLIYSLPMIEKGTMPIKDIAVEDSKSNSFNINDNVNHPSHYCQGNFECIDVMVVTQGIEAVKSFCICNAFKYLFRHNEKNGFEDVKKAKWYLDKYIELANKAESEK